MDIEEQFILLGIGWVFIFVRIFVRTRQVGVSGWELDDYLMPLAGVSIPGLVAPPSLLSSCILPLYGTTAG